MPIRRFIFLTLTAAALVHAQEPLNAPVPFAPAPAAISAGQSGLSLVAAQRAQELGFPSIAVGLYEQLLSTPGMDTRTLTLALATAQLDDGQPENALKALNGMSLPHTSAWHLRAGLAFAALRQFPAARNDQVAVKSSELTAGDRPWDSFLQGWLANSAGDFPKAADLFGQAESQAASGGTDLARARFQLARDEANLQLGKVTAEQVEQARKNAENLHGSVGYEFEKSYAVMLNALGPTHAQEAIEALQGDLQTLPALERATADEFRLLLGMIAGPASVAGRNALFKLLESGVDQDRQREALQLLERGFAEGPQERSVFKTEMDKLIGGTPPHPILDDLYLARANWALLDKDYAQAEDSVHSLLNRFPVSPLKPSALGVLTEAAWEQQHYRSAADYAHQMRDALPGGGGDWLGIRSRLDLIVAEAWYRARDYRSAADAYASVVRSPPPGVPPGELMFQRVEAEIKAGALNEAAAALDEEAKSPQFDAVDRWEAEWNLERALQVDKRSADAYDRVNRLLAAGSATGLPSELRVRMAWLQASLAVDSRDDQHALGYVDGLEKLLSGLELDPALKGDIASRSLLLKAQTFFDLKREPEALSILKQLRSDYRDSDAAAISTFAEANYDEQQDKLVEAQRLLTSLADNFQKSPYAPNALYQAAAIAERLGQEQNLSEAVRLLERLVNAYPNDDLVFDARMKEGDVFSELNQFPQAQQVYESLVKSPAYDGTPNAIIAQLALAKCDNAQSDGGNDHTHEDQAQQLFGELCERADAPSDVRVEAGYNLGNIYMSGDKLQQASDVWWREVVTPFLLKGGDGAELGEKGRYWMSRTLFGLAELFERQGHADQAVDAWKLVIKSGLPGAVLAQSNLANLNSPPSHP